MVFFYICLILQKREIKINSVSVQKESIDKVPRPMSMEGIKIHRVHTTKRRASHNSLQQTEKGKYKCYPTSSFTFTVIIVISFIKLFSLFN